MYVCFFLAYLKETKQKKDFILRNLGSCLGLVVYNQGCFQNAVKLKIFLFMEIKEKHFRNQRSKFSI